MSRRQVSNSQRSRANFSEDPNVNLKIVKTEIQESGEAFQLVRPVGAEKQTSEDIISKLVRQYGSRPMGISENSEEFQAVQTAFPNVAKKILNTYDGSNIISDSQQDLVGDRYLAEQIRQINEENRKKSILDKWSHLLYEGEDEKTYVSSYQPPAFDARYLQPIRSTTFTLNKPQRDF
ncbi:unnamed protein product [Brachionus calyciflorus]|uniref:Uncharacterized protein n=1 Tax=Brachionus calyciflorus TaxID=104777 RepID=A0A813RNB4_9BILA|nr:unnamed protein product [Brachionus calyciflorus]